MTVSKSTYVSPVKLIWPDGTSCHYEREVTRVSDLRETPIGLVDFGRVMLGPNVLVKTPPLPHPA